MKLIFFGLSLSSSWGNGHATTYRALLRALNALGHDIIFYERDQPWYADNRDLPNPDFCKLKLYKHVSEIDDKDLKTADVIILGSFVEDTPPLAREISRTHGAVLAFYDIDTPVTVSKLEAGECDYLAPQVIPLFDLYFSFSGGRIMQKIQWQFGAKEVVHLGCSVDTDHYRPKPAERKYALGYLGTYDESRQPLLEELLLDPAEKHPDQRFIVAGPQFPSSLRWPSNVEHVEHLAPSQHLDFYASLGFALNITRADMVAAGYSPSVRIFEAAGCGRPVISDGWEGLNTFFEPNEEILVASNCDDVSRLISMSDTERERVGQKGYLRVLRDHTARVRAEKLEQILHRELVDITEEIDMKRVLVK